MKKTILKITFDAKKSEMNIRERGIRSDNPAKDDETILFALASTIVAKLASMPIGKALARKGLDRLIEEMNSAFDQHYGETEDEINE